VNERQLWALTHPLDTAELADVVARRTVEPVGGALLVVVLAVDR